MLRILGIDIGKADQITERLSSINQYILQHIEDTRASVDFLKSLRELVSG